ncbi:hypothetical protein ALC53_06040 [Atta colombica]|uniref:Uncharacterized protein n=1 Tax=Atta colombica TaxID=520822 RepID=A0A195BHD5_9HYME|nr:hypothetical protein ALC53_06040 [Atta colombica]
MHTDIAPVIVSIAEQLPRYSLHAQQTGTTLPPLAVPFLLSYRTKYNEKNIEKTLEKEKRKKKNYETKNLAPRFARWHASNWNGQTDERTISEEAQPAVPDGGLPRHWRLLSLPRQVAKSLARPFFIPRMCYERMMCSQLANDNLIFATRVYTLSLDDRRSDQEPHDLSRTNCFVVADEPPGSSSIVHEPRKPSFAHIRPQNSQTSLCDRWNSLSLRLIGQFAKQSESVIFSCLEIFWGRLDEFLSESDVSMKRIVLQFQSLLEQSKLNGDVVNLVLNLSVSYILVLSDDRIEEVELLR